jgi:ATP synthase subunit 6
MLHFTTFTSPLEQFVVNPLYTPFFFKFFGLGFTNQSVLLVVIFVMLSILMHSLTVLGSSSFFVVPSNWQEVIEQVNMLVLSLVMDNIKDKKGQHFLPLLYCIFFLILCLNLFGLIPYCFTLTSHIIVTFTLALLLFIGINILGIKKHGLHYFSLFLPPGTSTLLAFLLVPIEFISYVFKPISLSIRLFANMMAGHTLLKVIAGFGFTLMGLGGFLFILHYIPLFILIPLFALEFGVALIQTFVFSILICIYINDAVNLH